MRYDAQVKLSSADKRLLDALQQDATRPQADLAEIAGMSRTSAWRRIRDFEDSGLIQGKVAVLDPQKAGFHIQVLLAVAMTEHTDEKRQRFEEHIAGLSAVTECFTVAGERDYVLHVAVLPSLMIFVLMIHLWRWRKDAMFDLEALDEHDDELEEVGHE